jgi:organic hydroperoxide reductase OsmC/OhrA
MSEHIATITWARRPDEPFLDRKFSRRHEIAFDGGVRIAGSPAPAAVRPPLSDPSAVDPEEALTAALSSCHMLWFLALAARAGFVVEQYRDEAVSTMARNDAGRVAIVSATLRPQVTFGGERAPSDAELEALHHEAHEQCNIANSVNFPVHVEGTAVHASAAV